MSVGLFVVVVGITSKVGWYNASLNSSKNTLFFLKL